LMHPPGHIPGLHVPGSLMPIPVLLEQQRQALMATAAAEAARTQRIEVARRQRIEDARAAMRQTGATCEIIVRLSGGGTGVCGVLAAGRCGTCHRAFCQSHQSYDRGGSFMTDVSLCKPCQNQQVHDAAERQRIAAEKVAEEQRKRDEERRREEAQEAQIRRQEEEQKRERDERNRREGAIAGLVIAGVGVCVGWFVANDWVTSAGVPYALSATVSIILLALGRRFMRTWPAAAAAAGSALIAFVGGLFLLGTLVALLWRIVIEHQSVGWGPPLAALIGALMWFGGAVLVAGCAVSGAGDASRP
jgi:cation transport ATPase